MAEKEEIKLFVVTHKDNGIGYPGRTYIHVGDGACPEGMLCDAVGDNIAAKNRNYCELTAVYWIWKNVSCNIVGIEHYRRVFGLDIFDLKNYCILKPVKIKKFLQHYDVICTKRVKFKDTLLNRYRRYFDEKDFDVIKDIIREKYPDDLHAFDDVMNSNVGAMYNMMICKKQLFDEYCSWLFDILFESEKYIDPSERDAYRARVFGFLSERLMNVWLKARNLNVKYVDVVRTDRGRGRGLIGVPIERLKFLTRKTIGKNDGRK